MYNFVDCIKFFISLEKDPQQEDFLQGRMFGNPYSSKEPGLGPLMRDIKNRICTDCELVALLEDDNSMEVGDQQHLHSCLCVVNFACSRASALGTIKGLNLLGL